MESEQIPDVFKTQINNLFMAAYASKFKKVFLAGCGGSSMVEIGKILHEAILVCKTLFCRI